MARLSLIENNNKRKLLVKSLSNKRAKLKAQIYDKKLPLADRFALVMTLAKLPRNSAKVRIRNRCALTGRPRGYIGKFGLSRNMLRDLSGKGQVPGLVKASW